MCNKIQDLISITYVVVKCDRWRQKDKKLTKKRIFHYISESTLDFDIYTQNKNDRLSLHHYNSLIVEVCRCKGWDWYWFPSQVSRQSSRWAVWLIHAWVFCVVSTGGPVTLVPTPRKLMARVPPGGHFWERGLLFPGTPLGQHYWEWCNMLEG